MRYDDQTEMGGGHATFFTTQWSLIEAPSHDHDDEDRILIGSLVIDHPLSGWPEEAPWKGAFTWGKPRWGSD